MNKKLLLISAIVAISSSAFAINDVKLNESVITTQNTQTTVRDTAANITIITAEQMKNEGATNLIDALRMVPGVNARTYYGDIKFNVGGYFPIWAQNNTVVTLDGVKITQQDASNIPLDTISRIEVIPNGGGILYGDGAAGGIINILTKSQYGDAKDKLVNGTIGTEFASHNSYKYHVATTVNATKNLKFDVNYSNRHLVSWRKPVATDSNGNMVMVNGEPSYTNKTLTSKYKHISLGASYKDDTQDARIRWSRNDTHYQYGYDVNQDVLDINRQITLWTNNSYYQSDDFFGSYKVKATDNLEAMVQGELLTRKFKTSKKVMKKYNKDTNVRTQLKYNYTDNNYVILGADYTHTKIEPYRKGKKTNKNTTKKEYGIYAINQINYGDFVFGQGFRFGNSKYDYWNRSNSYIPANLKGKHMSNKFNNYAFNLDGKYNYSDTGMAYVALRRTYRTPLAMEMDHTVGGKKLDTQIQHTIEIGVKDYPMDNVFVSASTYWKRTNGEIYYQAYKEPGSNDIQFPYYNIGDTRRIGVDLLSEQYFDKLTVKESITYLYDKIVKSDIEARKNKEIPFVPNWKLGFGVNYKFTENFNVDANLVYLSKYYDSDDPENIRPKNCGGYKTVDVSANYKFENGVSLTARINNLFDAKYADYVGQYEGTQRQIDPAIGRNFSIGVDYTF